LEVLSPAGHPVLAEESAADVTLPSGRAWVVDPLDGTANFLRGIPLYCVAIALVEDGEPVLGATLDAARNRVFSGVVGEGAWVGSLEEPRMQAISTSDTASRAEAVLATGLPVGRDFSEGALTAFLPWFAQFKKVRMFGTAGLSLAFVAAGAVDAYGEDAIRLWDVAAGIALVRAAGGHVEMKPSAGGPGHAYDVRAAGSPALWGDDGLLSFTGGTDG
jgi:myo-inositol-1(or 4)-monophosphatase